MNLSTKAMVMVPVMKSTTLKFTDKEASAELTRQKNAQEKSAKVVVDLINRVYLKPITAVISAYRAYIGSISLPWYGDSRLLARNRYFEVCNSVNKFKSDLQSEVDILINKYVTLIDQAKSELGDLWRDDVYPSAEELRAKFAIDADFLPVSNCEMFKELGLDDEEYEKLRVETIEKENAILQEATRSLFEKVQKRVSMLAGRLRDPGTKRYRESLVTGLETLVDVMPDLNVTDDPDLNLIMDDVRRLLTSFTMEEVKKDDELKAKVVSGCDAIMAKMSEFI